MASGSNPLTPRLLVPWHHIAGRVTGACGSDWLGEAFAPFDSPAIQKLLVSPKGEADLRAEPAATGAE
jgi:hypothetical protein